MTKVSVIVPVYNVEKYLRKCLDSLINQDFKDYEIIIVNDGSPDNSEDIISEYKEKYPKLIKAFKKENGGLSSARNYGLEKAKGKYICFIDSDDYVTQNYISKLYNKIISEDFDISVCDLVLEFPDRKEYKDSSFDNDLKTKEQIKNKMHDFYPVVVNKMYKKELFTKDNLFKQGIYYEDVEFSYRLFSKINSIGVIKEGLYYYYQSPGSISRTVNKKLYDHINNWDSIFKYYKDKKIYDEYKDVLEYSYTRYVYATFIKRACDFEYNDYLEALDYSIKKVKENTSKRLFNKYFYKSIKGLYLLIFNKLIGKILFKYMNK